MPNTAQSDMIVSRRSVLVKGAVIGAGLLAGNTSALRALAVAQPPLRRPLHDLAWNDPVVATLRDAVGLLKRASRRDRLSWVGLAGIHGANTDDYRFCPHGNWYFLPWHRAYISIYERLIRDLTANPEFALPYWDWTSQPKIPEVFISPKTPDGKTNWLYVNDRAFGQKWLRSWPANRPLPSRVVGPAVLREILETRNYEEFGSGRPRGQDNLDQSWMFKHNGLHGALEKTPHNLLHIKIGGWMPSPLAPRDPLFLVHHCNVDRIWALWNALGNTNSADFLWNEMTFSGQFINPDRTPYAPKVSDLVVPEMLGYSYGLAQPPPVSNSSILAIENKLTPSPAIPAAADVRPVKAYTMTPAIVGTAERPLGIDFAVGAALIDAVAKCESNPSTARLLSAPSGWNPKEVRALALLRDVAVSNPRETEYRIFLDHPDLSSQTPVNDPHFVGSFGTFEHGRRGTLCEDRERDNPSFLLDLTAVIRRLYGNRPPLGDTITLQLAPAPARPDVGSPGIIKPNRIELMFVAS